MKYLSNYPGESVANVVKELNLTPVSVGELRRIVSEIVGQPGLTYDKTVGIVMSRVRGRIEPQIVMDTVKKLMKK